MPSIFTHLVVAQDALEAQPAGAGREFLEANARAYYLGALCPDLPYFNVCSRYRGLPLGPVLSPVTHAVEERLLAWLGWSIPARDGWDQILHGIGAPAVLEAWARRALAGAEPAWAALAAGMVTHCAVDEVLHPKVNADGGDWSSLENMRRHRELEIALDYVLLRSRGVAVESLSLTGILETYLGRVGQNGEYLSPAVKRCWVDASQALDASPLRRGELDAWSRGFAGAMRLLEHPLSPMRQQQRRFLAGGEERWRTFFARGLYLASHVPRAARSAERVLAAVLEPLAGAALTVG